MNKRPKVKCPTCGLEFTVLKLHKCKEIAPIIPTPLSDNFNNNYVGILVGTTVDYSDSLVIDEFAVNKKITKPWWKFW